MAASEPLNRLPAIYKYSSYCIKNNERQTGGNMVFQSF